MRFVALRPEQIEEKARAENGGYGYANKDVERGNADVVVIMDMGTVVGASFNTILLIHVVWEGISALSLKEAEDGKGSGIPDSAAVPTDSDTTQRIMAIW